MPKYNYATNPYETLNEVEAAVTALKNQLENNPTLWCSVKPQINTRQMTLVDGTEITVFDDGDALSDTEIMAISSSDEGLYHVDAIHDGDNMTDLNAEDAISKVALLRNSYARSLTADKYIEITERDTEGDVVADIIAEEVPVTNEDMSVFTE